MKCKLPEGRPEPRQWSSWAHTRISNENETDEIHTETKRNDSGGSRFGDYFIVDPELRPLEDDRSSRGAISAGRSRFEMTNGRLLSTRLVLRPAPNPRRKV